MQSPNPTVDPRLQPTPDYGTLGPGPDINPAAMVNPNADPSARTGPKLQSTYASASKRTQAGAGPSLTIVAFAVGLALALLGVGGPVAVVNLVEDWLSLKGKPEQASPPILSEHDLQRLDRQPAQHQAELLLERAINRFDDANNQIADRVDRWHGHLKMTPNLRGLVAAGLNSSDLRVRAAAIEVDLAAYNIPKTPEEVREMQRRADSSDHTTKLWALWTLGALANRGLAGAAITDTLIAHLKDDDPTVRKWAVEGLALVGSDATIAPLLATFHDDPSPLVRERAACSLAQSGMLNQEQRMTAVPQILTFTDDPALDPQAHSWAFQALRDITGQALPNDPGAWRDWWRSHSPGN